MSLHRLPFRKTSIADDPRIRLEHSKLSATLPQLQGFSLTHQAILQAVAPSNPKSFDASCLCPDWLLFQCFLWGLEMCLSGRALVCHAQGPGFALLHHKKEKMGKAKGNKQVLAQALPFPESITLNKVPLTHAPRVLQAPFYGCITLSQSVHLVA